MTFEWLELWILNFNFLNDACETPCRLGQKHHHFNTGQSLLCMDTCDLLNSQYTAPKLWPCERESWICMVGQPKGLRELVQEILARKPEIILLIILSERKLARLLLSLCIPLYLCPPLSRAGQPLRLPRLQPRSLLVEPFWVFSTPFCLFLSICSLNTFCLF